MHDKTEDTAGSEAMHFSAREREVLDQIARGVTTKEVAGRLGLSIHTIHRHLERLFAKTGCRGRVQLALYAVTHSLVSLPATDAPNDPGDR